MTDWSPQDYLRFADERSRPARDLLAQVLLSAPRLIYDLGCGPGNSTALLDGAHPEAEIIGVDNSPAMLNQARAALPQRKFIEADIATWKPEPHADLLFSNATFQWVPDHAAVLLRLMKGLKPGAVLAVQMPDNLNEPSHQLMRDVAGDGPWAARLQPAGTARSALMTPRNYYELLKPFCAQLDIWHTVYNHALEGVQGIVDLVSSTGLRPFYNLLEKRQHTEFLDEYKSRLAKDYPAASDGKVLLRFPRLFMVAVA
jgi:trans-aconitate 2-methyltransferase